MDDEIPSVLVSTEGRTRTLTLHRPHVLNAVNEDLYRELIAHLGAADRDDRVRCVVLRGEGRAFCVGADLKAHDSGRRSAADRAAYVALGQKACERIQRMATPVVAAVHGYAFGAGAEMAVSADFLVMAEDAVLCFPEVGLGTFVGGGVTHRLPRLVGLRRATDLLLLGERLTGAAAAEWGLGRAVPAAELTETTNDIAGRLATKAPLSVAMMKTALEGVDSLTDALDAEGRNLVHAMKTRDWAEGVTAFAERRDPQFIGR